jgi:hypothetical protein
VTGGATLVGMLLHVANVAAAHPGALPAAAGAAGGPAAVASARPPAISLLAPPRLRRTTRLALELRPFLGLIPNSWGGVGTARLERYFDRPFMLGIALAPLAVAGDGQGPGAIAHLRVHGAYVTDYLAVGLGIGARLQRFGRSGLSIAPTLRLGSLDGLHLAIEYSHAAGANQYTGRRMMGFSYALAGLQVPLGRRVALILDGGLSLDLWAYATLGVRHRLLGDGGPGTWLVSGAFGLALVVDRALCDYGVAVPCAGVGGPASAFGPTIGVGVERRF